MREMLAKVDEQNPSLQNNENSDIIKNNNIVNNNVEQTIQPKFSAEEHKAAILRYKSGEAYTINAKLRENEQLTDEEQSFVDSLNEGLSQLPKYEGIVYRNVTFDDFGGQEALDEFLSQYVINEPIFYKQFISCSTKIDGYTVEGNYKATLVIESKTARNVEGYGNNNESEVVYPLNSVFVVKDVNLTGKSPIIYLQEVLNNGHDTTKEQGDTVRDMQESHTGNGDLSSVSKRDTLGDTRGRLRPQSTASTGQWDTLRSERRSETLLPTESKEQTKSVKTQADPNGPANFMPEGESGGERKRHHTTKAEQDFIKRICDKLGVKMKFIHITSELLAEKGYEFEDGILPDGFYDRDTDTLYIGFTVIDPVKFVFKHELTHFGEGTEQYTKFVEAVKKSKAYKEWLIKRSKLNPDVNSIPAMEAAVRRKYIEARKQERDFGPAKAESEMIADFVGEYLFNEDGSTIESILSGLNQKERNAVIQYILDFLSYLKKKLQGESNLVFEISRLEDNFNRMLSEAVQTKNTPTENSGDLRFSIVTLDSGKSFVQATRRIITGNSVAEWRSQISEFFNNALKNGPIEIETIEGDVLTISKDTANKARDRNVTENGVTRKLTDKEFLVKLHAESHIDELAELSTPQKNNIVFDSKNHSFAKDGFTYRTVYFQDFDDSYYKVTLSVGENNGISTVYNVGKIKADDIPNGNIVSAIGSKADMSSANSRISQKNSTVNNNISTGSENNSKGNIQFSFARPDDMSLVEEAEAEEAKWRAENKSENDLKTQFRYGVYDINLEVDHILPHAKSASENSKSTSFDINVPQKAPAVNNYFMSESENNSKVQFGYVLYVIIIEQTRPS